MVLVHCSFSQEIPPIINRYCEYLNNIYDISKKISSKFKAFLIIYIFNTTMYNIQYANTKRVLVIVLF